MIDVERLTRGDYTLLGELTHVELLPFVRRWFLVETSWLTRAHHGMSLATIAWIVAVIVRRGVTFGGGFAAFVVAAVVMFVAVLPLHEALHAVAYRLVGARDIRWEYSLKMMAVWVIAHRFVADRRAFVIVALAPFVVVNAGLLLAAIAFPAAALHLLFVLLWHLHGSIGDWSLLNFIWLHRDRGFWTFDDAAQGKSYFFGRAA